METTTLTVSREDVYAEVAKTTDYTGSKLIEQDSQARDRILITDEDLKTLGRFWEDTCSLASERLKEMYESGGGLKGEEYRVTLRVSVAFDKGLQPSIESALRSFFIATITGKWYVYANKGEAQAYFDEAGALIEDVRRKLYSRKMIRSPRKRMPEIAPGEPGTIQK